MIIIYNILFFEWQWRCFLSVQAQFDPNCWPRKLQVFGDVYYVNSIFACFYRYPPKGRLAIDLRPMTADKLEALEHSTWA